MNFSFSLGQLIAKLKAVFDRFDKEGLGTLNGVQIESALLYMNRPVDSHQVELYVSLIPLLIYLNHICTLIAKHDKQVNAWLTDLKFKNSRLDFPQFVSEYTVWFLLHKTISELN